MPDFKKTLSVNGVPVSLTSHAHPAAGVPANGRAVWLNGDTLAALADADPIGTWADSSGNGRNATQATGANKPTKRTVNGRAVARFDGSNDYLQTAAFAADIPQPTTFLIAFKLASIAAQTYLYDGIANGKRQIAYAHPSTQWGTYAGSTSLVGGTLNTDWHVLTAFYNGASSLLRVDGVLIASGINIGTNPLSGLTIGIVFDLVDSPLNGDLGDLLFYSRELSAVERDATESYLADRYGIAGLSPYATPVPTGFASAIKWGTD